MVLSHRLTRCSRAATGPLQKIAAKRPPPLDGFTVANKKRKRRRHEKQLRDLMGNQKNFLTTEGAESTEIKRGQGSGVPVSQPIHGHLL